MLHAHSSKYSACLKTTGSHWSSETKAAERNTTVWGAGFRDYPKGPKTQLIGL